MELGERVLGGMYGLLIGDALGVPFEFHGPEELPPSDEIGPILPAGFCRAHVTAPPGAWSDDGAQALCLLESLLECRELRVDDLASRLLRWADQGHWAVDGLVFDIGQQTARAFGMLRRGISPEISGPRTERDNGNGALMRVLPLALWHEGSDAELVRDAARQSAVTHGHPRSHACAALYCLWARALLQGSGDGWTEALRRLRAIAGPDLRAELEGEVLGREKPDLGSGYVVDTLHSVQLAMQEETFARVVQRAISFGNDTDTVAALAGGLAGVRFGLSQIPSDWLEFLASDQLLAPILARLLVHVSR